MILKSHDLDKWVAKYFVSKDETYRDTEKRKKDTEKCTIQYLFSMSVSFPYHFSIFSVSEFFIGLLHEHLNYCMDCPQVLKLQYLASVYCNLLVHFFATHILC